MVAQTGIDRTVQLREHLFHALYSDGMVAAIDDIACYEHQVRFLHINHVEPALELGLAVHVAEVQV